MKRRTSVTGAWWVSAVMVAGLLVPSAATAEEARSTTVVKELASLMAEQKLEALAAQLPDQPDRFVAALLIPGVQLLVVSAQYGAPPELQAQLAQKNYRDVYSALHQPSTQQTRVFFLDLGCDGLQSGQKDAVDVMFEKGTTQTLFDGNWKDQGLSEAAYTKKIQESELQYSQLLTVLLEALKGQPGAASQM